ncbi:hypothetical protein ASZ78_012882 [Callipepla squamata]|uniref:DH domain-containing protein n=1 Tax=Callipepla squamata TaxID=9009 RepID=A0A226MT45_CALSU|nr:hypothetical protein ASZ78_012882 [Callipepla squamata]
MVARWETENETALFSSSSVSDCSSICPKSLILSRSCPASATTRLVEQNVHNEAAQGINGSVPVKQSPRSASNPKPQVPPKPLHLQKLSPVTYQTSRHKALSSQKPRMEEDTPTPVSSVTKEKTSKVSDLIHRFEGCSPFSPIDLKKDSSALSVSKSQGRYGSTPPPQPKLPSQHLLLKQGNSNTDKTQVAQTHTANGVVAQDQVECEDRRILDCDSAVSTLVPDNSINSSLINGERVSTSRDSLETTTSYEGSILNSCYRTPSSDTLLPSDNEINTNVEEDPNEEIIKQDQPVETKETDEQKRHKIASELLQTEKAYVSRLNLLDQNTYIHLMYFTPDSLKKPTEVLFQLK